MKACISVLVGLLGVVHPILVNDLFPFSQEHDARLPNGNSERSDKLALSVPTKFYDKEYDYLWIHTDGYISFESVDEDVLTSDFPFKEAFLAPFMLDLDTANHGNIFYRESHDISVLARATVEIKLVFPLEASNFEAESALIVTWHEVEGRSTAGETATFTFQCVLVSNGRHTYAIFLYPENKMGVVLLNQKLKSAIFEARAGFNQDREHYLEMYPVDSLADHKNTQKDGEWIFKIGGGKVEEIREIAAPERRRHAKRQAAFINVQNINLEDEEEEDGDYNPVSATPRSHDYCSRAQVACTAENSVCINYKRGYCCHCRSGYIGNGKACLIIDKPVRVNGNVSGVIDVRDESGAIERMSISGVEMHSYVITREARAYTAISGVDPKLGRALQPMSAIGEAVAWLFSVPAPFALNGFQLTGGSFQRRVNIDYKESDHRFSMTQRFLGVREENNESVIIANTKLVGMLPIIPEDSVVKMGSYNEDYIKLSPGRYSTNSSRTYSVGDKNYTFQITQDLIFSECRDSFKDFSDDMKYFVTETFLNYHDTDNNVRYAIKSKVSPQGASSDVPLNPCSKGTHGCHQNAECEPLEGQDFACRCRPGFAGDGTICDDFNECIRNPCRENALCFNEPGTYVCQCVDGYRKNIETQECELEAQSFPCDEATDVCGVGTCIPDGNNYRCACPDGYNFEEDSCEDVDECGSNLDNCAGDARCTNTRGSFHCTCNPGLRGDGYNCEAVDCPGNQVYSQCARCFTTCEERSRPKRCTLQCREQCTCPPNTFLNGDMCVTAEQCPVPTPAIPSNPCDVVGDSCGFGRCLPDGNSYRCECPVGFSFRRGGGCIDVDECGSDLDNCADDALCSNTQGSFQCTCNPGFRGDGYNCEAVDCPGNQVYSQCAGCFTTCEERSRPKRCTLQCREQCTCPPNTFLNGDMCVTAEQCPIPTPAIPSNPCDVVGDSCGFGRCLPDGNSYRCECPVGFSFRRGGGCIDVDECGSDLDNCADDALCSNTQGSFQCTCNPGFRGDGYNCEAVDCPGNQVYSQCAGCFTTCEERSRPKRCTLQCREQCTCPPNTFLNRDMCVTAEQCPVQLSRQKSRCELEVSRKEAFIRGHPGIQDGPDIPLCMPDGSYSKRQCSGFTQTCWCVNSEFGTVVPYTLTERNPFGGIDLDCDGVQPPPPPPPLQTGLRPPPPPRPQTECLQRYAEVESTHQRNPGLQDGPIYPDCDDDGLFVPKQCNGFTSVCWCVDPQTGSVIPNTSTGPPGGFSITCEGSRPPPPPRPQTKCLQRYAEIESTHQSNPGLQDGPIYPDCDDDGLFVPKQCNGFTSVCWCVDPQTGSVLPNTRAQVQSLMTFTCEEPKHDTACLREYSRIQEFHQRNPGLQDGPIYPDCDDDGLFVPKQCNGFTSVCWCVDPQTGSVFPNTMARVQTLGIFACDEDRGQDEPQLTPCQQRKAEAQEAQSRGGSARGPIFQPICTEAGAFEPIQYHPGGYYTCVDVNGVEISRHNTEPQCLTQCQLQAYYAETDNTLTGANNFIPQCKNDGSYSKVQCDFTTRTCYCVNQNGLEIGGTRISTENVGQGSEVGELQAVIECPQPSNLNDPVSSQSLETTTQLVIPQPTTSTNLPTRQQSQATTTQVIFAQSMHISSATLPISSDSTSQKFYSGSGLVAVGVAFDCSSQKVYWTDVASRAIFMSPLGNPNAATRVIKRNLKSPEGVAVDFISGNIYWTDSGTDTIGVAKGDGSNRATLISRDLANPRGIAVDPIGGKLYWTDWNRKDPKIMMANLDGSQPTVLLRDDIRLPNDIVVDPFNRQLCFLDAGTKKIECMNLDGTGRAVKYDLKTSAVVSKPFALAVNGRKLYYTDRQADRLYAVDYVTKDRKSVGAPAGFRGHIYGVALTYPQCPSGGNSCSRNNGGCSHLCLPIPNGRTCKCPDGDSSCREQ